MATSITQLKDTIWALKAEIVKVLPAHIDIEKFLRVSQTAAITGKGLRDADRTSLLAACCKAAEDGLLPDGREAAFVVFYSKHGPPTVQYMPMVKGIIKIAKNSGEVLSIKPGIVYSKDKFKYFRDQHDDHFYHEPNKEADKGEPTHAYAIAKTSDNEIYVEIMTVAEVEKVRAKSRAKTGGPWFEFWDEMAKKTVVRRVCKWLPSSPELEKILSSDNEFYDLDPTQIPHERSSRSRVESLVLGRGKAKEGMGVGTGLGTQPEKNTIEKANISDASPSQDESKAIKEQAELDAHTKDIEAAK